MMSETTELLKELRTAINALERFCSRARGIEDFDIEELAEIANNFEATADMIVCSVDDIIYIAEDQKEFNKRRTASPRLTKEYAIDALGE